MELTIERFEDAICQQLQRLLQTFCACSRTLQGKNQLSDLCSIALYFACSEGGCCASRPASSCRAFRQTINPSFKTRVAPAPGPCRARHAGLNA